MLYSKKTQIPVLKTILILLTSTIIIIVYLIALHQMSNLYIEDKKIRTQIVESKILNDCFSNELGTIDENKFNQQNLNNCINENNNIFAKVIIDTTSLYIGNSDSFENKVPFCSNQKSNLLCTKLKYPVIVKNDKNTYEQKVLTLLIIVS